MYQNQFDHHMTEYNWQDDNPTFKGKYREYAQCNVTAMMSIGGHYSDRLDGSNDQQLEWVLKQIEIKINPRAEWALEIINKMPWVKGYTSQWWVVLQNGLNHLMQIHNVPGRFELDLQMSWEDFLIQLQKGPVLTNVYKLATLKGGHFINIAGWEHGHFRVLDPRGDANKNYKNRTIDSGNNVFYEQNMVKAAMVRYQETIFGRKAKSNHISALYFKPLKGAEEWTPKKK